MTARGTRVGPRGLTAVRAGLSERDLAVLASVAAHRFLTTRHVEQLHFADHASPLAGARVCRRVLARLHEQGVLSRLQRRVGGVRAGSASFVWTLGPVGDRLLREASGDGVRQRFREPSAAFLDHCLAVAETHLRLVAAHRAKALEVISVELEPACWRSYLGTGGEPQVLKPDLAVVTASGQFEDCWFLEIDRATESVPTVLRKCRQYEAYRRTGIEQERVGVFPVVVWVVPHALRRSKLLQAITDSRRIDAELFRVVLAEDLVALLTGGAA